MVKALKIKAFAEMPTKKAKMKILVNQQLALAIGFVAGAVQSGDRFRSAARFCA
jgi:hypothetical protein